MLSPQPYLAFDSVGWSVIHVAWATLAILILALLAASISYFSRTIARADDIVFEATLGLDRESALLFHGLYRGRHPKNIAIAWVAAVLAGPIGAFGYLRDWPKFTLALLTLNGLGAWWIESWFSTPQLVLIENKRAAIWALEELRYARASKAEAHV